MSLSKQDMKYLANGNVVTEEALIVIAAAKRDDFEGWCKTGQFKHFLMRARLGSPSEPMTLPRLQMWASLEENEQVQGPTIKSAGPTLGAQTSVAKPVTDRVIAAPKPVSLPKGLNFIEIDDLLNGNYSNNLVARMTQRDIKIIIGRRTEPQVACFLRDLLGIREDHDEFTAMRLVSDWVYDIKFRKTQRECRQMLGEEPTRHHKYIDQKLVQNTTPRVSVNEKKATKIEEGSHFVGDDLIAFA
ncbi:hypothetical protein IL306_007447 [Fusarium sp. DS 682]|nr:hypothetical protein IL306_007447 [Fusarium sp. DS 682]